VKSKPAVSRLRRAIDEQATRDRRQTRRGRDRPRPAAANVAFDAMNDRIVERVALSSALACSIAARSVQVAAAVAQTPSDESASPPSSTELTTNVASRHRASRCSSVTQPLEIQVVSRCRLAQLRT
jgi:hypothetical protein